MKIKRQKHSVKIKIRLFCSKEQSSKSSWSRIRATGAAEGTEKQKGDHPVAKTREDGNGSMTERRLDEARCHHSAAEDSESHGRRNYAE